MSALAGADGLNLQTEYRLRVNRFAGCQESGCRFFSTCSSRYQHQACPFGDEAFEAHNPRDREAVGQNTILNTLLDYIADKITGTATAFNPQATYIAVGTGTGATTGSMTDLQTEVYRAAFVDATRPSTGKGTFYWFFAPGDFTGTATEWGFAANGATGVANSGDLINRFLQTLAVTSSDAVVGQYSIVGA